MSGEILLWNFSIGRIPPPQPFPARGFPYRDRSHLQINTVINADQGYSQYPFDFVKYTGIPPERRNLKTVNSQHGTMNLCMPPFSTIYMILQKGILMQQAPLVKYRDLIISKRRDERVRGRFDEGFYLLMYILPSPFPDSPSQSYIFYWVW